MASLAITILVARRSLAIASSNTACGQTSKKTPPKIPLLLHDVITGTDRKENTSSFHSCVA
jgi:hypothetical protein